MDVEVFVTLAALGVLGLVVIGIPMLLVGQARLRRRVAALEAALAGGGVPEAAAIPDAAPPAGTEAEDDAPPTSPAPGAAEGAEVAAPKRPGLAARLGRWLRGNWAVAVAG
ncbi:MAG TPA: DUF2339 domain-containing protein, partial [Roseovarius sp.]|nr:DUF2339 domain-containing protein [Roseovarius sp.]